MKKTIVEVKHAPKFEKQLLKAPLDIKRALRERLALFLTDQHHPLLHNHQLVGVYSGHRSIFIALGTHSQLYR